MTYDEALDEQRRVSAARARTEIEKHHASWADFQAFYGVHAEYRTFDVLAWLGY